MAKFDVKKSNDLVKVEEKISKAAQLWVSYLVACLPKTKVGIDDFPTLDFTFKEIKQAVNADGKKRIAKVDDVFKIGKELMKTPLWYENENRRGYVSWLTEVSEDKTSSEQKFTFAFHPKLKPYLLNLENQYTIYNYFYRVCLSTNSMKIYEILKRYQYLGQVNLNIEKDIKEPLGLVGKYEKYYDFRRKVLDIAQTELAKFTDINFEYEVAEKKWNKAIALFIIINKNIPTDLPGPLLDFVKTNKALPSIASTKISASFVGRNWKEEYPEVYFQLVKWGGKEALISKLISDFGIERVYYQIEHVKRKLKENKKIKDAFAWFRKAIQEDYMDPVQESKKKKEQGLLLRKEKRIQKKEVEHSLSELKAEKYKHEKQMVEHLFSKDPLLLHRAITDLVITSSSIRRESQKKISPEDIYKNIRMQGLIINKIKAYHPEAFEKIETLYLASKAALEKE